MERRFCAPLFSSCPGAANFKSYGWRALKHNKENTGDIKEGTTPNLYPGSSYHIREHKPLFGTKQLYSSLCSTQSQGIPANTCMGQLDKIRLGSPSKQLEITAMYDYILNQP